MNNEWMNHFSGIHKYDPGIDYGSVNYLKNKNMSKESSSYHLFFMMCSFMVI